MGVVVRLETVRQQGEVERWRRRGYEAVDQRVEKLRDETEGKDFEALSALLGREGQELTGAIFEEVLKSRGAKERSQDTQVCEACGRTLKRQKQLHTKTVDGGKPPWRGYDRAALFLLQALPAGILPL